MTDDEPLSHDLSPAGQCRRQQILALAARAARSRRRRRTATRSLGVVAAIAFVAAVMSPIIAPRTPIAPPTAVAPPTVQSTTVAPPIASADVPPAVPVHVVRQSRPTVVIQIIATDPTLADRLAVRPTAGGWESIGTDELLRQLNQNGLAGGVVVRHGKPTIWFSAAADDR